MSFWTENDFDSHPVWEQVDALAAQLDNLPKDLDPPQRLSVVRLKSALELLREHQQKALKEFYTPSMLGNVEGHLRSVVIPALTYFVDAPESYGDHVNTAADRIDQVFDFVAQWPSLPAGGQAIAAGKAFSEYRREAELALETIGETKQELAAKLDELTTQINAVETQMRTVEERYATSLGSRDSEYADAISSIEQSGKMAYDKAIATDLESRIDELDGLKQQALEHLLATKVAQQRAEGFELSSKTSADFIAKKAIATDFGRQARSKTLAGVAYEAAGIVIGGGTIIMLLRHYLSASAAVSDNVLAVGLARFSVTVGLFVIAGYLLSRGASNHRQARASKSADIRLQTLEAFISKLDAEEQDAIRRGMAENIFLHGRLADDEKEGTWTMPSVFGNSAKAETKTSEETA